MMLSKVVVRFGLVAALASSLAPASAPKAKASLSKAALTTKAKSLALAALVLASPVVASADGQTEKFKLPPVDKNDKSRCVFKTSSMGQANGARDKLFDLRQCDMTGKTADGFDLAGAIMSEADFSCVPPSRRIEWPFVKTFPFRRRASFKETVLSKSYARNSKFDSTDFTNGARLAASVAMFSGFDALCCGS